MDFTSITEKIGLNPMEALDGLSKITEILPKIKSFLPMVKEWEKTLALKEGQKVIYSLMPTETEVYVYVFIIEQKEGQTIISDQKYKFTGFEELEKVLSFIPKT